MGVNRYFERLQTIDYLIRVRGTGRPAQLAKRMDVSVRTLYEFLNVMRSMGAPIKYDKYNESYYYSKKGCFQMHFIETQVE